MCKFVSGDYITPGVGCCNCRTYNGLQREVCKSCEKLLHDVKIPDFVEQCDNCGFGLDVPVSRHFCPSCKFVWKKRERKEVKSN
jgi:hypothetical protein